VFGFSFSEILVICVVALVAVGPQKLPGMLKTMGQWARKLRQMTMDVRQQTGIDEMLRAEGIQLSELRGLMRGYHGAPAPAPAPAPVASTPRYEDPYAALEPDPTREYPLEGADSYGALPDDLLEPPSSNEVAAAPGAPAPKPEPQPEPTPAEPAPAVVAAEPAPAIVAAEPAPAPAIVAAEPAPAAAVAPAPAKPDSLPEVEPEPEPLVVAKPVVAPVRSVPPPPPSSRAAVPRPSGTPPPPPRRASLPAPRPEPSSPLTKPEPAAAVPAIPRPGSANGNG
jgi:sec-independent protein translocase protein TatB